MVELLDKSEVLTLLLEFMACRLFSFNNQQSAVRGYLAAIKYFHKLYLGWELTTSHCIVTAAGKGIGRLRGMPGTDAAADPATTAATSTAAPAAAAAAAAAAGGRRRPRGVGFSSQALPTSTGRLAAAGEAEADVEAPTQGAAAPREAFSDSLGSANRQSRRQGGGGGGRTSWYSVCRRREVRGTSRCTQAWVSFTGPVPR